MKHFVFALHWTSGVDLVVVIFFRVGCCRVRSLDKEGLTIKFVHKLRPLNPSGYKLYNNYIYTNRLSLFTGLDHWTGLTFDMKINHYLAIFRQTSCPCSYLAVRCSVVDANKPICVYTID